MGKTAVLAVKIISDAREAIGGMKKTDLAIGAVVAGAIKLGKDFVDSFTKAGGATLKMQRIVGGTAEEASRLSFAVQQSGLSSDQATGAFGKLEKTLTVAAGTAKGTKAMTKLLGEGFTDARGRILPMDQILPGLMDKFERMKAGPARTALAMKLFGKSGADMLPFLTKGSAGLDALAKKSDAYGNTLTGANLQAIKDSKAAQRDWGAAVDGFKIQFGAQLLPLLTTGATLITSHLVPAITTGTQWLIQNHDAVAMIIGVFAGVIGLIKTITMVTQAYTAVQAALNIVMSANPIGLIVIAIAALIAGFLYLWATNEGFRNFFIAAWAGIQAAAAAVSAWWTGTFMPAFNAVWNAIVAGVMWFTRVNVAAWRTIIGFVQGIPGMITGALSGLGKLLVTKGQQLITGLQNGISAGWSAVTGWLRGVGTRILAGFTGANRLLLSVGTNMIRGLWAGISGSYEWIKTQITGWVGNVVDFFKKVFGISSPSRRMGQEVGRWLLPGAALAVQRTIPAFRRTMALAAQTGMAAFDAGLSTPTMQLAAPRPSSAASTVTTGVERPVEIHLHGILDVRGASRQILDILTTAGQWAGSIRIDDSASIGSLT